MNILDKINYLMKERGWTEYKLAKNCGISQSTISTWFRKNQIPTIQSLNKICKGFGITLSQFFAEGNDAVLLSLQQRDMLNNWNILNKQQQQIILNLLKNIYTSD